MNIRSIFLAVLALVLAVGAGTANAQSGSAGTDAATMRQPLQVYHLLSGPAWIYYKNRNRYHKLAYANHLKIFNKFTAISFVNTASQTIRQVSFELAAYSDVYRPVIGANGHPVVKRLVATGPFAPGAKQTLVNANVVWSIPPGNGLGCVRLSGMQIVFADDSSTSVPASELEHYLAPQLSNSCGVPPDSPQGVHRGWVGPTPYISGVFPAKWMVLHNYQDLYRQPYVPPADTQPLCAVGSFLQENCGKETDGTAVSAADRLQ